MTVHQVFPEVMLQPCACGAQAVPGWFASGPTTTHFVHCCDCGAWASAETEAEAAAEWNARARKLRGLA